MTSFPFYTDFPLNESLMRKKKLLFLLHHFAVTTKKWTKGARNQNGKKKKKVKHQRNLVSMMQRETFRQVLHLSDCFQVF